MTGPRDGVMGFSAPTGGAGAALRSHVDGEHSVFGSDKQDQEQQVEYFQGTCAGEKENEVETGGKENSLLRA